MPCLKKEQRPLVSNVGQEQRHGLCSTREMRVQDVVPTPFHNIDLLLELFRTISVPRWDTFGIERWIMGNFKTDYDNYKLFVVRSLEKYFSTLSSDNPFKSSLEYTLSKEGKLFRPVFSLAVADYLNLDLNYVADVSLLLELIHVSSLIHDDLPALDDDDIRRGKPACHKKFGEGAAILLGDYLICEAYKIVSNYVEDGDKAKAIIGLVSKSYADLCIGQIYDLEFRDKEFVDDHALSELERINALKTGALFELSVDIPIVLSGVSAGTAKILRSYSKNLGLIFQLSDDILDEKADLKDKKHKEISYIDVLGLDATKARAEDLVQSTIAILNSLPDSGSEFLRECVYFARGRKE